MSAPDAPNGSKALPSSSAARYSQDSIWPSPSYRSNAPPAPLNGHTSPTDQQPSTRNFDFGITQSPSLAPSPHSATPMNTYSPLSTYSSQQRTPTQPSFSRSDSLTHSTTMLPPAPQTSTSHAGSGGESWPYSQPSHLEQSTSIPDGETFAHLPTPFPSSEQLPSVAAIQSMSPHSKSSGSRSSRKKEKARDEPQSLEELKDPLPGQKPDYPYPTLIRCAILSHGKRSPTLSEIYDMIHKRFSFFRMDDAGWKNSVRHYLSISPSFVKLPRPITEPGKGNYWTYDPNPTKTGGRRKPRNKRKPDRDDETGMHGDYDETGRVHRLQRHSPTDERFTPSSSDTLAGDAYRSGLPSLGARDRGIASRQKSPAHGWLEARDTSLGGPPRQMHRENLPPAQSLFSDIARPPAHLSSHHINSSGAGGVSALPPYAAGDDGFGMPQSPYAPANRASSGSLPGGSGAGGNGGMDYGASPAYPARDQVQYRASSSSYSQSLPPLPTQLGESFFQVTRGRHDDSQLLPSMSGSSNGSYTSLRSPPLMRADSTSSQQQQSYRYEQSSLAPSSGNHWAS